MSTLSKSILETAEVMGLSPDSEPVRVALETAEIAMQEGYGVEIAMDMARSVLNRGVGIVSAA